MGFFYLDGGGFTPYLYIAPALASLQVTQGGDVVAASGALEVSGGFSRASLGALGVGDPDEAPALAALALGTLETTPALGALEASGALQAPFSAALEVADSAARHAPAQASLDVGTRAGQAGALSALQVRAIEGTVALAVVEWSIRQILGAGASLDVATQAVFQNLGTLVVGNVESAASLGALEIRGGEGFTIGLDIIDAIINSGRGDAGC